jgi:hypothetical protein
MGFKLNNNEITLVNVKNQLNAINKKSLLSVMKIFEDSSNWFSGLDELSIYP